MDVCITPKTLSGAVTPPPSKSMAHRAILASLLSGSGGITPEAALSQDIWATARCVAALRKSRRPGELPLLDCGESGSTLRFLIPVALVMAGGGIFTGQGRLMERPQGPYFDLFQEKGVFYERQESTLTVRGTLSPGVYRLPGNVSSQFITGLLFALPLLEGDSEIRLTTPLESGGYVDMTLDVLAQSGIRVETPDDRTYRVPGRQVYQKADISVEADWSQASFWWAAKSLGSNVRILDLNPDSTQGDKVIRELYGKLAEPGDVDIDVSGIPDLLPPLAVMAAVRSGTTRFGNAARLRMKESDRLSTVRAMLEALGTACQEGPDSLTVTGGSLTGGTVDGANDHRIVMAAAIAATACTGPVTILGAEAVKKSYPDFWEVYKNLGGAVHVL